MLFSGLQTYSKTKHGFEADFDTVNTEPETRDSKKTGIDPQRLVSSLSRVIQSIDPGDLLRPLMAICAA